VTTLLKPYPILKIVTIGLGGVKDYLKLCDVIYGQPLNIYLDKNVSIRMNKQRKCKTRFEYVVTKHLLNTFTLKL
jgi:hypothetical protein